MKYEIIGSSSSGNCIIVEDILMLDCGLSYSRIKRYLPKVKIIFISHAHQDHMKTGTIKKICFEYPNIKFMTSSKDVLERLLTLNVPKGNIYWLRESHLYDLGATKVKTHELIHDTPNYALKFEINDKKGIYIIDTASVEGIEAKNYSLYLIENNYREDILEEHIRNCIDENELFYLRRVPKTHLSDEQVNSFLIENMGKDSEYVYIHQSNYNFEERK